MFIPYRNDDSGQSQVLIVCLAAGDIWKIILQSPGVRDRKSPTNTGGTSALSCMAFKSKRTL